MTPCPSQVAQRPPPAALLNEKRAGVKPCVWASGHFAKIRRTSSQTPRKVAGTDRGVRPIGDWSTAIARRRLLGTRMRSCAPGSGPASFSALRTAG
jgi:hypothetical protein